ncbi:Phytochrome-like protein cph1 [Labrys miyagiensis]
MDLEACAREPIRVPGAVQPHGCLMLLAPADLRIHQWSDNCTAMLGLAPREPGAACLAELPDAKPLAEALTRWVLTQDAQFLGSHTHAGGHFDVSAHRTPQGLIVEFEPVEGRRATLEENYPRLRAFVDRLDGLENVQDLCESGAQEVRNLTGFNRVLVYRFDPEWHGRVLAEDGDGKLPSYLDLRFPASDIPAQARELYRINRLRLIPDANYQAVRLTPERCPFDDAPLDMSLAALRSVSPIHLQYMRNMGTIASMSISIVVDNKLWGLVSCHHAERHPVSAATRAACDFLGRVLAQAIGARERSAETAQRLALKAMETSLVAHLSRSTGFQAGLVEKPQQWLGLTNAEGAAVSLDGIVLTAGQAPPAESIGALAGWLHRERRGESFATDHLASVWPEGEAITAAASGVIATPIARLHPGYLFWFRPEVVRTVKWGGDPYKAPDSTGQLNPRSSFDVWKETVRRRAEPWNTAEIHSASDFRVAIVDFVLQRAEERAQFAEELQRSNRELEAFSYSISHDLRAPFRHIAGYAQLLTEEEPGIKAISRHYLDGISQAAVSAGKLVDDLLHFSHLGRTSMKMSRIDMQKIAAEIRHSFESEADKRRIEWRVAKLPAGWGDPSLIRQVVYNLVDNAVKYTQTRPNARISISGEARAGDTLYTVEDNGVGFDMAYAHKLFQVFQRLHRAEEFEGTGIGLALTKRIIDRHGGMIRAEGTLGKGATFSFTLPNRAKDTKNG